MPAVHNGKMRETIFAKQKFTDEFEPVGGLFYGQCAEYCGNSHAYMSFRALAQSDEDFTSWVEKFQRAQNPTYKLQLTTQKKNIRQIHLYHFPTLPSRKCHEGIQINKKHS